MVMEDPLGPMRESDVTLKPSCVDEGFTKQGNTIWFHLLRDALSKADVCLEGCGRSRETTEDAVVTAQAELTA